MDDLTRERYGQLAPADLDEELWPRTKTGLWPWRDKPQADTPPQVARRRRDLWRSMNEPRQA